MRLWYLNWETTKGILKPNAPMQAAMRGMLFEFECFAYFKDVSCMKWTVSMHISLFQGYSACRNGGHWSGPRLVPSTQPQSCRSVWTHRAVRHRGAVYHVCRCPPPHEYPLASGFPVCTLPASKTMVFFSFYRLFFFSMLRIEARLLHMPSVCSYHGATPLPSFRFLHVWRQWWNTL